AAQPPGGDDPAYRAGAGDLRGGAGVDRTELPAAGRPGIPVGRPAAAPPGHGHRPGRARRLAADVHCVPSRAARPQHPGGVMKSRRVLLQVGCVAITLFMLVPLYLIALAAFSTERSLNQFPLALAPTHLSTETMSDFLGATGVVPGFINSLQVGVTTVVLSL